MSYDRVVMSSGHGKYVRGASGVLDEVDEARRVVEAAAANMRGVGIDVVTFHDDVSQSQSENLQRIVDFHNSQVRDLDISVHFNAYVETTKPMGTEVLYATQEDLADRMSEAIADTGFVDRGSKYRSDLYFLNETAGPAILIEVCFVDSEADAAAYGQNFDEICASMASVLLDTVVPVLPEPKPDTELFYAKGLASHFGGPDDEGVSADEGLAFIQSVDDAPQLFLPYQPEGTTGLARRLNPFVHYVACRWDYDVTPKEMLLQHRAMVVAGGIELVAFPADWGPNEKTGRVADLSPSLMEDLGLETDDEVEVIFPYIEED
jgi:N-acetylmuramoyl-L-alanine amidase